MITSLCPALGSRYSVTRPHCMCPAHLQLPQGKELPISITGMLPYVIKNEKEEIVGGAELEIIDISAKKFNFKPKFIPETIFDGGMLDTVMYVTRNV